jgi:hypothetical protein
MGRHDPTLLPYPCPVIYIQNEKVRQLNYETKQASQKWITKMNVCSILGTGKFSADPWWESDELSGQQRTKKECI